MRNNVKCVFCGTNKGIIRKLKICRRCFKNKAKELGFHKYD